MRITRISDIVVLFVHSLPEHTIGSDTGGNSSSDSEDDLDSVPTIRQAGPASSTPKTSVDSGVGKAEENMDIDSTGKY